MSNTGAEVTSGVDCVSGGATKGVTDDNDDERNAKRANRSFGVAGDKDPEDKDSGADGLSDAVPRNSDQKTYAVVTGSDVSKAGRIVASIFP